MELTNEQCRNQAKQALYREEPEQALRWINLANGRTSGHGKSARYEAWGDQVAEDYGIERHNEYAADADAVLMCFKCRSVHTYLKEYGCCANCHTLRLELVRLDKQCARVKATQKERNAARVELEALTPGERLVFLNAFEAQATRTLEPWAYNLGSILFEGIPVAHMNKWPENENEAAKMEVKGAFIVRACNAHAKLLEACERYISEMEIGDEGQRDMDSVMAATKAATKAAIPKAEV